MKKKSIFFAVIVCILLCVCAFVGCDKKCTAHEFTFGRCNWNEDGTSSVTLICAVCGEELTEEADVKVETIDPTCTEPGKRTVSATVQIGGNTLNHYEQVTVLPAPKHKYSDVFYEWTSDHSKCTAKKVCSVCGDTVKETANATATVRNDSTCVRVGKKIYSVTFKNEEFGSTSFQEDIPLKAHDYTGSEIAYAWDQHVCTATRKCRQCGLEEKETVAGVYSVVREKSCDIDGLGRYTATFKMPGARPQTQDETIPKGHDYDYTDVSYKWNDDHTACIADVNCVHGDDVLHLNAKKITEQRQDETCVADGKIVYTATFTGVKSKTYTVILPNKGGHKYGEIEYIWSKNNKKCTARKVCSICGDVVSETVSAEVDVTTVPTCTEAGEQLITAVFDHAEFTQQQKTEVLSALGHAPGDIHFAWDEDHTECVGKEYCARCEEQIEEITRTEEEIEVRITVEKTCETDGKRVYRTAFRFADGTVKMAIYTETIPASHEYEEPTYEYNWVEGILICTAKKICSECGDIVSEEKYGVFSYIKEEGGKIFLRYTVTFDHEDFGEKTIDFEVTK